MGKYARRSLIALLLGILLAILLSEALLARLDPLGFAYFRDQMTLASLIVPDPRGYNFRSGTHVLSEFAFTLLPDGLYAGTRAVPDTNPTAAKTLVFVGDSVTFGYGVDDAQTWVNLVARQRPDWQVVNAGVSGYNSTNVRRSVAQYPAADALVYLIVNNDAEPENLPDLSPAPPDMGSWLALYLVNLPEYLHPVSADELIARGEIARYFADLRAIRTDGRVRLVAFDDAFGRLTAREFPDVALIERGTDRVSPADGHPGVRGNQEIAAQMLPLLPY